MGILKLMNPNTNHSDYNLNHKIVIISYFKRYLLLFIIHFIFLGYILSVNFPSM
jgi:hypothetical protein